MVLSLLSDFLFLCKAVCSLSQGCAVVKRLFTGLCRAGSLLIYAKPRAKASSGAGPFACVSRLMMACQMMLFPIAMGRLMRLAVFFTAAFLFVILVMV